MATRQTKPAATSCCPGQLGACSVWWRACTGVMCASASAAMRNTSSVMALAHVSTAAIPIAGKTYALFACPSSHTSVISTRTYTLCFLRRDYPKKGTNRCSGLSLMHIWRRCLCRLPWATAPQATSTPVLTFARSWRPVAGNIAGKASVAPAHSDLESIMQPSWRMSSPQNLGSRQARLCRVAQHTAGIGFRRKWRPAGKQSAPASTVQRLAKRALGF